MYRVAVYFEDGEGERVYFADIQAKVKKEFGAFGKPQINVGFDLSSLEPAPMNKEGFYCRQILPHTTSNLFARLLQIVCLACTCGLWTFGAGYLLLLEKND